MFPVPNATDRALLLLELKIWQVRTVLFKLRLPSVKVKVPDIVRFAPNVKPSVEVFKVTTAAAAPLAVVQVPVPDNESKITVSTEVGFKTVATPPEVIANCVLPVADQVPVPPTQ
jgi:hypothetical protein